MCTLEVSPVFHWGLCSLHICWLFKHRFASAHSLGFAIFLGPYGYHLLFFSISTLLGSASRWQPSLIILAGHIFIVYIQSSGRLRPQPDLGHIPLKPKAVQKHSQLTSVLPARLLQNTKLPATQPNLEIQTSIYVSAWLSDHHPLW